MRDFVVYVVFRTFALLCSALGVRGSAALGYLLGLVFGLVETKRRRVLDHMANAFGRSRARSLLPKYHEHLGLLVVELARLYTFRGESFTDWIEPEGVERLKEILAGGRGFIGITGHLGCWELAGHCVASSGVPVHALYRPLKNRYLDGNLRRVRERSGMLVYEKKDAVRGMIRALRAGKAVALLMDQDGSGLGVFVPFFGRLASTLPTAARIARRTGAAIVPVTCYRLPGRTRHALRIGPEVEQADTGDEERDVLVTTRRCNRALEQAILEHSAQWLWRHRRWRTRPGAEQVSAWQVASRGEASADSEQATPSRR
ncbi:MAG: lysophospholipid acyltransferase family protein [Planctomycetota bacterium]